MTIGEKMTAIGDALKRAGFDYVKFQLDKFLRNYILAGGTEEILVTRFRAVLAIVAKEMAAGKVSFVPSADSRKPIASGDHSADVPQDPVIVVHARDSIPGGEAKGRLSARTIVGLPPAGKSIASGDQPGRVPQDQAGPVHARGPIPGGEASESLPARARIGVPPAGKPTQKQKSKLPSQAQRDGMLRASKITYDVIFDRQIGAEGTLGNIAVSRLHNIAQERADVAAGLALRSFRETADAVLCELLSKHCIAADPFTKIKEAIPTKVVKQAAQTAEIKAAELIRDHMAKFANAIMATANKPQIEAGV